MLNAIMLTYMAVQTGAILIIASRRDKALALLEKALTTLRKHEAKIASLEEALKVERLKNAENKL